MDREAVAESTLLGSASAWLIWLGLLAAFSPVVLDLVDHVVTHPWARIGIVFPWLAWIAVHRDRAGTAGRSNRLIWICLLLAIGIELLAVSGDVLRLGRFGLVIAAVGLVRGAGWAGPASALVLVWLVPLPNAFVGMLSPALETTWGSLSVVLAPGVGLESESRVPAIVAEQARLVLQPEDGGLAMGFGLAGLGWFQAAAAGGNLFDAAGRALRWGVMMVPAQLTIVALASIALAFGSSEGLARSILDEAGWLMILVLALVLSARTLRTDASGILGGQWKGTSNRSMNDASDDSTRAGAC
ncbi:MAG: hypothetical protein CL908_24880 [Deltaproteobacteria bacterium]|nr:hypothetical protein [Deltaproteobacteria bacterium]